MRNGLGRWLAGDPWDVVPLHGAARWYVVLMGIASIFAALGLALDGGTVVTVHGLQYGSSIALVIGAVACLLWAWRPSWRGAYAVAGSVLAATFLTRAVLAIVTLLEGAKVPWAVHVAGAVYTMLGFSVLVVWRHLAPVIRPRVPPESPRPNS